MWKTAILRSRTALIPFVGILKINVGKGTLGKEKFGRGMHRVSQRGPHPHHRRKIAIARNIHGTEHKTCTKAELRGVI